MVILLVINLNRVIFWQTFARIIDAYAQIILCTISNAAVIITR